MIFILPDEKDPIYKTWVMLINGYGYNWYRQENQLRADDLLVRQQASHFILEGAKKLQEQEAAYASKYLPTPTRANPFPPPENLATHARIRDVRQTILALEARIRGLAVPSSDRIWQRHRSETDLLEKLRLKDVQLVGLSQSLDSVVGQLSVDDWNHPERLDPLLESIGKVDQVIAERSQQLLVLQGASGH